MKQNLNLEELKQDQQQTYFQSQPEELSLSDGQTQDLPEFSNPETQPQQQPSQEGSLPDSLMTTIDSRYYSQGEFESAFNEFLSFLKNPATAADTFETVRAQGQTLAAAKVFEMAKKYRWLNWIIDRRTQFLHDTILLSIFAITETNAIVLNWTGISLIEKGKIWLKSKVKARASLAQQSGKRSVWGFLARQAAGKAQKAEN